MALARLCSSRLVLVIIRVRLALVALVVENRGHGSAVQQEDPHRGGSVLTTIVNTIVTLVVPPAARLAGLHPGFVTVTATATTMTATTVVVVPVAATATTGVTTTAELAMVVHRVWPRGTKRQVHSLYRRRHHRRFRAIQATARLQAWEGLLRDCRRRLPAVLLWLFLLDSTH